MRIGLIGCRGIPNYYGGFEQFAEYLSVGLVEAGHEVVVYNSHTHPYQESEYKGVEIRHIYDPENRIGTAGQFVYDFLSIRDSRKQNFDIILQLGYTSSTVFSWYFPKNAVLITNMDGLEWSRSKYSKKVQKFLQYAESLGVRHSDHLIADSLGIQEYLKSKYGAESTYIPYGAHVVKNFDEQALGEFNLEKYQYNMLIARLEPENNIEMILEGIAASSVQIPFLVVGKHETSFGEYLKGKFSDSRIRFVGAVYDMEKLNTLRGFSNLYFHGHSVGGTNPSLLEAMASNALICANDNKFNSTILEEDAFYFSSSKDVTKFAESIRKEDYGTFLANNVKKIETIYTWPNIVDSYEELFKGLLANK
ncbi:DUF1972 domain-containing protein [Sulfurimonas diazotrophicus]|uniref:DUF1972 domain-containing protein n=1 Tax=Sulfurimonas diazotrophicus TaxID=3131939 RepID=A0ABZ3HAR5_9BACT